MGDAEAAELKKKRTFRKYTYRGVDLDQLLDMNNEGLMELFTCRIRRKFNRGLKRKPMALIKKLRKKKKECPVNEKPDVVKTHLRNMIVVPEMTGSIVGVYNGKVFTQVEIKPEMIGHYLGEFSISYKVILSIKFSIINVSLQNVKELVILVIFPVVIPPIST